VLVWPRKPRLHPQPVIGAVLDEAAR